MKTVLITLAALLIAAPAFAEEPATQPAKTDQAPSTQPAEKPKARLNDAPPRKPVPVVIKEAKDVWKLLPEDLRPGKDGKVSDELAEKIKDWAKENKGKFEGKAQFVATKTSRVERGSGIDAFFQTKDGDPYIDIKAHVQDEKEYAKIQNTKFIAGKEKLVPEFIGTLEEFKMSRKSGNIDISILLKEVKVVRVSVVTQVLR